MSEQNVALEVEDLWVSYGESLILEAISFRIERGRFVGIIGPNGAGKTTLFKAILGIIPVKRGRVRIFGEEVSQVRDKISYVPQMVETNPMVPLTCGEMVAMGLVVRPWGLRVLNAEIEDRVRRAMASLAIEDLFAVPYKTASMGQKQRVLIARALVKDPQILFLDEPTASVDEPTETNVFYLLNQLKGQGMTIVMISHDIGVLSQFVDEIACLNRTLVYHGKGGEELSSAITSAYSCPVDLIAHGMPHRVLKRHGDD